jgi:hypothetical protein
MQCLRGHCIAFQDAIARLYEQSCVHLLGLIEILTKFNPTMQRRVQRITINKINDSTFGLPNQNEPIPIWSSKWKRKPLYIRWKRGHGLFILNCTYNMARPSFLDTLARTLAKWRWLTILIFYSCSRPNWKGSVKTLLAAMTFTLARTGSGVRYGAHMTGQVTVVQRVSFALTPQPSVFRVAETWWSEVMRRVVQTQCHFSE